MALKSLARKALNRLGLDIVRTGRRCSWKGVLENARRCGLQPGTLIDVGVAYGTPELYRAFPSTPVLLVEPLCEFEEDLRRICAERGGRYVVAAAGAKEGEATLHVHRILTGSSMYREAEGPHVDGTERTVNVTTVDTVVERWSAAAPYLLKVDVQGAELDVVLGARETLKRTDLVLLEVSFMEFLEGAPTCFDVVAFMKDRGFVLYDIWGAQYRPLDAVLAQAEIAFVREASPLRQEHSFASRAWREESWKKAALQRNTDSCADKGPHGSHGAGCAPGEVELIRRDDVVGSHASSTEVAASVQRDPPLAGAYYSHHKCATMYVHSILERVCRECGFTFRSFHNSQGFGGDLAAHLSSHPVDFLSYINAEWNQVAPLGLVPGFHVVRDPRDIWVSAYFSHLYTHETSAWPELEEHRQRLKSVEKEEGLFIEMGFIAGVFEAIAGWNYQTGHVLELRFEELTTRPYTSFLRIFEHLGMLRGGEFGLRRNLLYSVQGLWNQWVAVIGIGLLPYRKQPRVPAERLLGIVYDNRFSKKTGGRDRGDEDRGSHYRKGVSGDWRKHLTDKHLSALQERFPGLLEVSGYGA